jgi:valyl-tRNA synthetase
MSNGGSYDPHAVEAEIYRTWEEGGYFHAAPNPNKRPFVVDIPLPNVTGALHLGHALNNTLQDVLIRHARMRGFEALWMPGTDHAGIATQAVVERRLKEEQNLTRHELGREELVKRIWEWKEKFGGQILTQLRKMGCSLDWPRTRFTLDEVCARAVYEVFFRWFKEGLVYRGVRLVNWDAFLQTAVADDEIVHETVKGHLWHYRYPILPEAIEGSRDQGIKSAAGVPATVAAGAPAGGNLSDDIIRAALARAVAPDAKMGRDYLTIATTRPETMLGDTAVAVHPGDERYQRIIGRYCLLPLMNRPIPIIADAILVKQEFGTGCVKVTPGHDPNDYAFGQRHPEAPAINILTPDGKINENGRTQREGEAPAEPQSGECEAPAEPRGVQGLSYDYVGLDRYDARKRVVADIEALGLMEKIEPYETEVGHSDRSKTPIEPMLSEQWFVKMGDLAERAMEAVRDGRVQFFPARYAKTYLDWLGEKRDWCISRQLWWGHRIPVWTKEFDARELHEHREEWLDDPFRSACECGYCVVTVAELNGARHWHDFYAGGRDQWGGFREALNAGNFRVRVQFCVAPPRDWTTASLEREKERLREHGCDPAGVDFCSDAQDIRDTINGAEEAGFVQDPDVLDTWFSSSLWPFSTLGWPHSDGSAGASPSREDFEYFYPTSTLVTARGIITLWVARMVMTGLHFPGRVPFQHVHIHPVILDGQGRIMSKSLGNGVEPLDIITLYGTDALRFTMAQMDTETQDVRMPVKPVKMPDGRTVNSSEKFELGRNFCNKIWQAATGVVLPNLVRAPSEPEAQARARDQGIERSRDQERQQGSGAEHLPTASFAPRPLTATDLALEDRWILSRLAGTIAEVDRRLECYQISEVANLLYTFFWSEFCDWYLELVKPRLFGRSEAGEMVQYTDASSQVARQVLAWVLDQSLRLLHPITPFVTEALWAKLNAAAPQRGITLLIEGEPMLIRAAWPEASAWPREVDIEDELAALQNVIRALRDSLAWINTTRAAAKTPAIGKLPKAIIRANAQLAAGLQEQTAVVCRLGRCEAIEIGPDLSKPPESATKVSPGLEIYVPIAGLADLDSERKRLAKDRDELTVHMQRLEAKLANQDFVGRAPPAVVEKERARLLELRDKLAALAHHLAELAS